MAIAPDFHLTHQGEFDLSPADAISISDLLHASFDQYPAGRIFFPQPPHLRILCWQKSDLVGHAAGVIREVRVGEHTMMVMGVADLCVAVPNHRQHLATKMVEHVSTLAKKRGISLLMALSGEKEFFSDVGFEEIDPKCTWLAYLGGKSLGLCRRPLHGDVWVKPLTERPWPEGDLDFLGPMF
ncbi:MAG: GNAT family N-acetyltransferase [Saprospiraceae bacterium]|nr:GNAT family N-acetyltransferase [Saprospiraceae bacterium]